MAATVTEVTSVRHMNVEIGAEAALFPEKEYKSGIFVAVQTDLNDCMVSHLARALTSYQKDKSSNLLGGSKIRV